MKVVRFDKMSIWIPMKDGDTIESIEKKMLDAIDSVCEVSDGAVGTYTISVEEFDD